MFATDRAGRRGIASDHARISSATLTSDCTGTSTVRQGLDGAVLWTMWAYPPRTMLVRNWAIF